MQRGPHTKGPNMLQRLLVATMLAGGCCAAALRPPKQQQSGAAAAAPSLPQRLSAALQPVLDAQARASHGP